MAYSTLNGYLTESLEVIRASATPEMEAALEDATQVCVSALTSGKPILVCGNGGSAADAMHIAGELIVRYLKQRRGYNCICLSTNCALLTAWANDCEYETIFSRQVETFGSEGAVLIAISTSGNSPNVLEAVYTAREMGIKVIGLTGNKGGKMADLCDVMLCVPSSFTPMIQQVHTCLYHYLCERVEAELCAIEEQELIKKAG